MNITKRFMNISAEQKPQSLRQAWLALTGLSAVFLFEMLDNSVLTVALPTIGKQLHSSPLQLGWASSAYSVAFGGLMLLFGAVADRFGRKNVMLIGLLLLAITSAGTLAITNSTGLITVRFLMGVAAAMTTPLATALAFRLFPEEVTKMKAMALISTVGLVGLAVGPTIGGLILTVAPWQVLLLMNAPVALLAFICILFSIRKDRSTELHHVQLDILGAVFGTGAIIGLLTTPSLFSTFSSASPTPWCGAAATITLCLLFVLKERRTANPLLQLHLLKQPPVSAGLLYKAATGVAVAGLSYLTSLQLQLDYGWSPTLAAIGMLPQVLALLAVGPFVPRFVKKVGYSSAAWISGAAVVLGLIVYAILGTQSYIWVAVALVAIAAGLRVNGLVAAMSVMSGLPENQTSIGSALVDTVSEIAAGVGVIIPTLLLSAMFVGDFTHGHWDTLQAQQFHNVIVTSGLILSAVVILTVLVAFQMGRRGAGRH